MKSKHDFDLVVLDVLMPNIDGFSTFRTLKSIRQDLRVLFTSSGGNLHPFEAEHEAKQVALIEKPFHVDEFIQQVEKMLQP